MKSAEERERLWAYTLAEAKGARWAERGPSDTIEALHFLRRYGSARELGEWIEKSYGLLRLTPWDAIEPEDAEGFQDAFRRVGPRIRDLKMQADEIEASLRDDGYEYDEASRTLKRLRGARQRGGDTRDLFTEEVERVYWALREEGFPEAQANAKPKNGRPLREAIAMELEEAFHPDLLDPAFRAGIKRALDNHVFHADRH